MANLEIQIGADKTDFDKKIKEVEFDVKQLAKIKQEQIKLGLDTTQITAQIKDAKKSLTDFKNTAKDAGNTFSKDLTPKVANGGNALIQFSRIAQDAPYGIIGIGNNITATAESFSYLRNQTGSTGGALKALASSLMGTGGILLAVSLVTTAFTIMSQSGLSVGDVFDKLTGNFNEFSSSVKKASEEGLKSVGKEVEGLRELVAVAQNDNLSKKDRLVAVERLQSQFPAYYGNLSREQIMYGDLTKATHEATKALIAKSVAEKLGDKAGDKFIERLNAQQKFNDSKKELDQFDIDIAKKREQIAKKQVGLFGITEDIVRKQEAGRINILRKIEDERQEVIKLQGEYVKFGNIIDKLNETAAPLNQTATSNKSGGVVKPTGVTPKVQSVESSINTSGLVETSGKVLQIAKNVQGAEGMITTSMGNIQIAFDTSGAYMLEALQNLNDGMNELISGSIADTFGQLGTAIGEALATGGNVLSAIGNTLLQSLGKFLSDMGGMLIQYGTLALVKGQLDIAIATGGPAAIVAGLAAIGVGIALKAIGGAIGAKAKGGAGQGSMQGGNSVSSPTSSTGGGGGSSFQGGTVVFEISGQSLIGVLGNTLDKNRRLGGSLSLG